jgi:hypothetical protein
VALILAVRSRKSPSHFFEPVLRAAFDAFFDCAIYFSLAVELASVVMLVRKDFGLSTSGFGASDAQIALANSVVCILPLLYYVGFASSPESEERQCNSPQAGEPLEAVHNFRLLLFCLLTVPFSYAFYSQCIHNWGPSRITIDAGPNNSTLTESDWQKVVGLCFGNVKPLGVVEARTLAIFELLGGMAIYLFTLWRIANFSIRQLEAVDEEVKGKSLVILGRILARLQRTWKGEKTTKTAKMVKFVVLAVFYFTPLVLSIPLLRGIFRLRQIQGEVVERRGGQYMGNEWAFGQIIGVVIFAPVVTQACYAGWKYRSLRPRLRNFIRYI